MNNVERRTRVGAAAVAAISGLCIVAAVVLGACGGTVSRSASAQGDESDTLPATPLVTIEAGESPITEGTPAEFTVRASVVAQNDLVVTIEVEETGSMLASPGPNSATISAGNSSEVLSLETEDDGDEEPDSTVTVAIRPGESYEVGSSDMATADVTVTDGDVLDGGPSGGPGGCGQPIFPSDAPTSLQDSYHGWSFSFDGVGPIAVDLDFYANNVVAGGSDVACPGACREANGKYDGDDIRIFLHTYDRQVWVSTYEVVGTMGPARLTMNGTYNFHDRDCTDGKGDFSASRSP